MNYIVKKQNISYNIKYMEYDLDCLLIHPKLKGKQYVHVTTAKFYNDEMIKKITMTKFTRQFESLVKIVFNYLAQSDDEADSGDFIILLDEVAHLQATMEIRYKRFMDNEMYREYMDKLYFLDVNLKNKLARVNLISQLNEQLGGGMSR